ncbi:hypothetical protein NXW97_17715 [Bacteroides faecis]|uniref:Transposase n=1 Tax=Bacteroides faecis TaxID=674529 RepID=A0AAW5NZ33_9BACE|nr:hypothetical protein [Bacteroides faecis]MCS2793813.1 hypothetical protein [Bacteroides faecis]
MDVLISKVRLPKLCLPFKDHSHDVDDVIVEGYLCYLLITILL